MHKRRLIIFFIICILITGCKKKENEDNPLKQKDKAPQSLGDLSKELDTLLAGVGNIERIGLNIDEETLKKEEKGTEGNKNKEQDKSGEQTKNGTPKSEGENGEMSKNGQNSNETSIVTEDEKKDKQTSKPEKFKETWSSIDRSLEKVHSLWNEYGADRMNRFESLETMDKFEISLNKMTKAVEDRNILDIYDFGSQCFLDLKHIYDLYTDEYRGDVSNLKYMVYRYYLNFINKDKIQAEKVLKGRDEGINRIRVRLEKDGRDEKEKLEALDKVSAGFKGLDNVFEEESQRLAIIKKDNLIESLKALE